MIGSNEKSKLDEFKDFKINEDLIDDNGNIILTINSKLTTSNINLITESNIKSVIINPIQALKDDLNDVLIKFKEFSKYSTEETFKNIL